MELLDEDFQKKKSTNKTRTVILVLIVILFIIMIAIVTLMATLKEDKLVVNLDGQSYAQIGEMLVFDEENPNKVYIPIRVIVGNMRWHQKLQVNVIFKMRMKLLILL